MVAKHVTKEKWDKLGNIVTKTSGFTLAKAIACAVEFDNQHCGIYAGDEDSYIDFADVFDPLICEYHGLPPNFKHVSDMDPAKVNTLLDQPGIQALRNREDVAEAFAQLNKDPEIQELLKSNSPASKELAIKLLNHPAVLDLLDQAAFRAAAMSAFRHTVMPSGNH